MPSLSETLFGSPDKMKQVSTKNPQQTGFLNDIFSQLSQLGGMGGGYGNALGLLQQYLNPQSDVYKNFEQPYLQEFYQQTVPGIAERFAGYGGGLGGGLSSSGFGQSLGAAGANLQTNLAAMKSQMGRQSIQDLLGQYNFLANLGLGTNTFQNVYQPGSTGLLGGALTGLATGAGAAFGGPFGAALGNAAAGGINSFFNQR